MRSAVRKATATAGDVAARVAVRFDELIGIAALVRARSSTRCPPARSPRRCPSRRPFAKASAMSKAGAARCSIALECGPGGTIRRCHPHDPSWAELARARACGDRQHRSGFSADQQIVQPLVQRPRPLDPSQVTAPCCTSSARSQRPASRPSRAGPRPRAWSSSRACRRRS